MNERDIELASQGAALHGHTIKFTPEILTTLGSFADLVRADEREACAEHYLGIMRGAIALEREACVKLADSLGWVNVDDIKARGNT